MKANLRFQTQPKLFWANVRTISQALGYTDRLTQRVRTYQIADLQQAMQASGLKTDHLVDVNNQPSQLASDLIEYFSYRANILNDWVEPRLMREEDARLIFDQLYQTLHPTAPIPMNKQSGSKKKKAYFTGIVNMLIEAHLAGLPCDYEPRTLTMVTRHDAPLRTLSRRMDGCFPSCMDPIAVWEIKEYYYTTTTFGSRIADGVYETLVDGLELEELFEHEQVKVQHVLMIDAYDTWWLKGKSYLCRLVDLLHMGYVDEVLFGREVLEVLPAIVNGWAQQYRERLKDGR